MTESAHPPIRLDAASLRLGDAYELVVFDRLGDEERAAFAELAAEASFYGVLRPRQSGGGRNYLAVDRETALLLLTLGEPGALPFFARGTAALGGVADLVLDGVLEIEHDGAFLGGPAALALLAPTAPADADHPLGRLSDDALRCAIALGSDQPQRLASFLYDFNRLPVPPDRVHQLAGREAVLAYLGFAGATPARRQLEAAWAVEGPSDEAGGWIRFTARQGRERNSGATYKLYLSPSVEALPAAFAALVAVLERRGGSAFKVGADAAGVHRPDKLVAYFADREALLAVARDLEERLAGMAAHGVPFSAPIDPAGLLSWGVDPPSSLRPLSWQGPESWRTWLAGRLAIAVARAAGEEAAEARRFALSRVAREGVDVERWLPAAGLFRAA